MSSSASPPHMPAAGRARRAEGAGGGGGGQVDVAQTHDAAPTANAGAKLRLAERDKAAPPASHAVRRRVCLQGRASCAFWGEAEPPIPAVSTRAEERSTLRDAPSPALGGVQVPTRELVKR